VGRVYAFDGTLWKPPTNGLMPFDLSRAGAMATPDELQFYNTSLAVFLGLAGRNFQSGQLFQNAASRAVITGWMATFNKYRDVLNADVIHVRKPTGRSWDAVMHAAPGAAAGATKCFALFYNPTLANVKVTTALDVYYCGFAPGAVVAATWDSGLTQQLPQGTDFTLPVACSIVAHGYAWVALA
jgi:hypothetical protein